MKGEKVLFSSNSEEWSTPQDLFDKLNDEYHFTLDPCCTEQNHKCDKYFTKSDDGLSKNWGGERVFCNPPYGRAIADWVKKCSQEAKKPNTLVVLLIPARTDTLFFHDFIYHQAEIRFLRGRLKFGNSKNSAPFPSMLAIFDNRIGRGRFCPECGQALDWSSL